MKVERQKGQTLIETIVAIFILTTALTAGLALTIYILANSGQSVNEIIATNLAREGVEVVRMMRDTNWLQSNAAGGSYALTNCNDSNVSGSDFVCYPLAWKGVSGGGFSNYDLSVDGNYSITFDAQTKSWTLTHGPSRYDLYLQSNGTYNTIPVGVSTFSRKILISHVANTSPFGDVNNSASEIVVTSIVGWSGRGCRAMTGTPPDPETTNCSSAVTERLTNWKDY